MMLFKVFIFQQLMQELEMIRSESPGTEEFMGLIILLRL